MSVQVKQKTTPQGAYLEQMSGSEKGRVFELHAARLTLGRSADCDVVLELEGVSRVHALLVNSEGSWFIRDNNSKNGIAVNGIQVKESWLEAGDLVQMGTFLFKFEPGLSGELPLESNLPAGLEGGAAAVGGGMDLGIPGDPVVGVKPKKAGPNRRVMIYAAVLIIAGGFYMLGGSPEAPKATEEGAEASKDPSTQLARDFKVAEKPSTELGTKVTIPLGMEDPLLKKAEKEMAKLDWTNTSLREAEQFFRRGQREYLNHNYHRAIEAFQTALSLYGGHLLAERYLRRAVYEVEIEAKNQMAMGVQYYESLQYARAISNFQETIALMAHRPNEPIIAEALKYIKQAELRLQAAELFP